MCLQGGKRQQQPAVVWWEDREGQADSVQMTDNMFNLGWNPVGIWRSDGHTHTQPTTHTEVAASALVTRKTADLCKDENTAMCIRF